MLARQPEWFDTALEKVCARWGQPDLQSEALPFTFTDYYNREMGAGLLRKFYSFPIPLDPSELAAVKVWTNTVEQQLAHEISSPFHRPVNLDPGYVNDSKLILASAKDYSHRIYLSQGIYAEVTLIFRQGAWRALPWTYPDYQTPAYHEFFARARRRYLDLARQRRNATCR